MLRLLYSNEYELYATQRSQVEISYARVCYVVHFWNSTSKMKSNYRNEVCFENISVLFCVYFSDLWTAYWKEKEHWSARAKVDMRSLNKPLFVAMKIASFFVADEFFIRFLRCQDGRFVQLSSHSALFENIYFSR